KNTPLQCHLNAVVNEFSDSKWISREQKCLQCEKSLKIIIMSQRKFSFIFWVHV
ncbi:hypothetical protein L9F63_024357, partial [Diploptera punctata]